MGVDPSPRRNQHFLRRRYAPHAFGQSRRLPQGFLEDGRLDDHRRLWRSRVPTVQHVADRLLTLLVRVLGLRSSRLSFAATARQRPSLRGAKFRVGRERLWRSVRGRRLGHDGGRGRRLHRRCDRLKILALTPCLFSSGSMPLNGCDPGIAGVKDLCSSSAFFAFSCESVLRIASCWGVDRRPPGNRFPGFILAT